VSGSGISWAIYKSAPSHRPVTTPAPHHSIFYRPDALPASQPTAAKHWNAVKTYVILESTQRVHISAKLRCLRPDRNFKFHLWREAELRIYIFVWLLSLWQHNIITSPGVTAKTSETVLHFCYISPQPLLRSWTWLYRQKANKTTFPTMYCPYGSILNFSCTSWIHFSTNNALFRQSKPMGLSDHRHRDTQKWKHDICQFHSVRLVNIIRH